MDDSWTVGNVQAKLRNGLRHGLQVETQNLQILTNDSQAENPPGFGVVLSLAFPVERTGKMQFRCWVLR